MTRSLFLVGVAFCVFLMGCDEAILMNKYAPLQDEPIARNYLDLLMQGKVDQIAHDMDPSVVGLGIKETLRKLADMLPADTPKSVKVVGAQTSNGEGLSKTDITYECEFQGSWYLVGVALQKKGDVWTVLGLRITRLSDSLENLYRFTLFGKSAFQYLVLALAVFFLFFTFYVLVLCIRAKSGMTRWMWISFILAGVGRLAINWTTGEWAFTIWAIQVPCASATAPPYGPWTIAAYLPLGAIFFLNEQWRDKVLGRSPHS